MPFMQTKSLHQRLRRPGVLLGWGTILLVLVFLAARFISISFTSTSQRTWEHTVGEITGPIEVGQLFESVRPRLHGVAFQMATYGGRENSGEVIFELRESLNGPVLRTAHVDIRNFRDHQSYVFRFPVITESRGKVYYASLRAPDAQPGSAITLDYSNHNPYQKLGASSLVVIRGMRSPKALEQSIKPGADLVFSVAHRIPLAEYARLTLTALLRNVQEHPTSWRTTGVLLGSAFVVTLLTLPISPRLRWLNQPRVFPYVVGVLLLLGIAFRLQFATHLPATNDEGTALYDAWTVQQGRLPGGDGILKAPVLVGVFAGAAALVSPTISNGRLVSLLIGALTFLPLASIARRLNRSPDSGVVTASLWLLSASPALFSVYVHAQPLQVALLASGLALLAVVLEMLQRTNAVRKFPWILLVVSGICLALAVGARKTGLAATVPALVLIAFAQTSWRRRCAALVLLVLGAAVVLGTLVAVEHRLYGRLGVRYFLGVDVAAIDPSTTASLEERQSALIKGVLPILREAPALIFLALVGLGAAAEAALQRFPKWPWFARRSPWAIALALALLGRRFFLDNERGDFQAFGIAPLWLFIVFGIVLYAVWPRAARGNNTIPNPRVSAQQLLVPLGWMLAVGVLYASWIKFTANYLSEFLPPLVLLAGSGAAWISHHLRARQLAVGCAALLVLWASAAAARSGYAFPHTGTFDLRSLAEAANIARARIPPNEPVLTAALAVPLLSGHRVTLDIAHPTHYAYGYIEPHVRNVYMPTAEQMVDTVLHTVRWVVLEKLTAFSYFREYPEIEQYVSRRFTPVAEIENLSNPITILQRTTN